MSGEALIGRGLSKTFGPTLALRDADLALAPGRVRALLGQNGSGKSTLIKILAGFHDPDPGGELTVHGRPVSFPLRTDTLASLGVGFMHQDLGLEETMTIVENYVIGQGRLLGPVRWRSRSREVALALREFGLDLDVTLPVSGLTAGQRSVLALARAVRHVGREGGILVLDEPTASMDRDGVELLFGAVRRLTERGAAVLFVGHNLEEAMALCDDVTVLRDGAVVADAPVSSFDEESLIRAIVGRDIGQVYPPAQHRPDSDVVLAVDDLQGHTVRGVSLRLHAGEVLGVTGLAGMGHDEVPELVYGHHRPAGGEVRVGGVPVPAEPPAAMRAGVVLVPGDRKRMGVHTGATVEENVSLPVGPRFYRRGWTRRTAMRRSVERMLEHYDVRPRQPRALMGQLSGGNQQRAIIGKWLELFGDAKVLLLCEPVHGVDVAARQAIFRHIRRAADEGIAVLYVSSEHEDLAHLCDRVIVMRNGRAVVELSGDLLTPHEISAACMRTST